MSDAVRLLRSKAAELQALVLENEERLAPTASVERSVIYLAADVALIAGLLADLYENMPPWTHP